MYSISLWVLSSLLVSLCIRLLRCKKKKKKETRKRGSKLADIQSEYKEREGKRDGEGIWGLLVVPGYSTGPTTPTATTSVTYGQSGRGQMLML